MGEKEEDDSVRSPVSSHVTSKHHQSSHPGLSELTNTTGNIAKNYDSEYTELCHVLEEVADNVEHIKRSRMTSVVTLSEEIENLIDAVQTAHASARDTSMLKRYQQEFDSLKEEKQRLMQQIMAGKEEGNELKEKTRRIEHQMRLVRLERDSVKDQKTAELPSLEYLKKVLTRLSNVYFPNKEHHKLTQGFVCKDGSEDVRPFRFDESVSHFDKVNQIWKLINED